MSFLLDRLEFFHELPVDIILENECGAAIELHKSFSEDTGAVTQVEYQQVLPPRIELPEFSPLKCAHQVVQQHGVFPDRVHPYLVKGIVLEIYAVATAEYVCVVNALEIFIDHEPAVRADAEA